VTEKKHPNQAATGLRRIAEAHVPQPPRGKALAVKEPVPVPAVTQAPRQVPNFVLKHSDRGTRIVHTFKGKGIWEVRQEAVEDVQEVYDAALKDGVPTEGYWMEDGLIQDQLGDFLYDGQPGVWRWYATLAETETRHEYV
jgi:hypothetical protein